MDKDCQNTFFWIVHVLQGASKRGVYFLIVHSDSFLFLEQPRVGEIPPVYKLSASIKPKPHLGSKVPAGRPGIWLAARNKVLTPLGSRLRLRSNGDVRILHGRLNNEQLCPWCYAPEGRISPCSNPSDVSTVTMGVSRDREHGSAGSLDNGSRLSKGKIAVRTLPRDWLTRIPY